MAASQPIKVPVRCPGAPWIITHHVLVNPRTHRPITNQKGTRIR